MSVEVIVLVFYGKCISYLRYNFTWSLERCNTILSRTIYPRNFCTRFFEKQLKRRIVLFIHFLLNFYISYFGLNDLE